MQDEMGIPNLRAMVRHLIQYLRGTGVELGVKCKDVKTGRRGGLRPRR
jgi:hypothetical protein